MFPWPTLDLVIGQKSNTNIPIPENPTPSDACLIIVVAGNDFDYKQVGQKYMLDPKGTYLGTEEVCEVRLPKTNGVSRNAILYYEEEEGTWLLENLTEGIQSRTYVNDLVAKLAVMSDEDNIQSGRAGAVFRFLQGANVRTNIYDLFQHRIQEEKRRADTDALTQIANRGSLDREIKEQIDHCRSYERPLSAIFIDIDYFKQVNTTYTHAGGDSVITHLAVTVQEQIRPLDTFARYGGEEFVVLLRGASFTDAMMFGERIRSIVEKTPARFEGQEIFITVSVGVATLEPHWNEAQLLGKASACLLRAKEQGRNRVVGSLEAADVE